MAGTQSYYYLRTVFSLQGVGQSQAGSDTKSSDEVSDKSTMILL